MSLHHAPVKLLTVEKFVSDGKRVIRGVATTPSVDRSGDVVEPMGGRWTLPLPLLFAHRHDEPVGRVLEATATAKGIEIVAEIAEGIERADQIWAMTRKGLLAAFSIGFRGIEAEPIATGQRWKRWELLEISLVTVPANPDARVTATKGAVKLIGTSRSAGGIKLASPNRPTGAVKLTQPKKPEVVWLDKNRTHGAVKLITSPGPICLRCGNQLSDPRRLGWSGPSCPSCGRRTRQ